MNMPKTAIRLMAASAIALAAGAMSTAQLSAAPLHSGDVILAQAGGGAGGGAGGAGGGAGAGGSSGSGGNDSGRQFNDRGDGRMPPPNAVESPSGGPTNSVGVPARCQQITDPAQRQACINTPPSRK